MLKTNSFNYSIFLKLLIDREKCFNDVAYIYILPYQ